MWFIEFLLELVASIWNAITASIRQARLDAVEPAWREATRRLDGDFSRHEASPGEACFTIDVEVDGVFVAASIVREPSLRFRALSTEITAPTSSGQLRLSLEPRGASAPLLTDVPGGLEVTPDDPVLAEEFRVVTNDAALAEAWLAAIEVDSVRRAPGYRYLVADYSVRAVAGPVEEDTDRLVASVKAVAALARGGLSLLDALESAASALGVVPTRQAAPDVLGGLEVTLPMPGTAVRFDLVQQPLGEQVVAWTRFRADSIGSDQPFVALHHEAPAHAVEVEGLVEDGSADEAVAGRYRVFTDASEAGAARLAGPVGRLLVECEPTIVADDGHEVTLLIDDLDATAPRLAAAIRLVAALCSGSAGPYR